MITEKILTHPAVLALALLVIGYALYQFLEGPELPDLPIVGAKPGEWFPLTRAKFRNLRDMRAALQFAYNEYPNQACILPVFTLHNYILLPPNEYQWLVDQTESDVHYVIEDEIQFHWTFGTRRLVDKVLSDRNMYNVLTKKINGFVPGLLEETRLTVDDVFGTDTEKSTQIKLYGTVKRIICQVSNRAFVGPPFCRNVDYVNAVVGYLDVLAYLAIPMRSIWEPFRSLVSLFVELPTRMAIRRLYDVIRLEVERRLEEDKVQESNPQLEPTESDILQWSIETSRKLDDPFESDISTIVGRIIFVNIPAAHTSATALTHVILDLICSKQDYIDELRSEISSVLAEHGGELDRKALISMVKLDSLMRESQRINSFAVLTQARFVRNKEGIETPSGIHLPHDASIAVQTYARLHDAALYPDPETLHPFRFVGKDPMPNQRSDSEEPGAESLESEGARYPWVMTSTEYPAFGHGPHSCPGRFFASTMVKTILAYIIMHYDIERQEKRPKNFWFGVMRGAPPRATIRVRRRKEVEIKGW